MSNVYPRRSLLLSASFAAMTSARSSRADILAPGSKYVSHKMKFENLKEYQKDYKFFFLPNSRMVSETLNETGVVHVSGFNPVDVARSNGFYLVAVPRRMLDSEGGIDPAKLIDPPDGVLKSERLVSQIRAVQKSDKDEFWTTYHVKIVDGKLQTGLIRHDEPKSRERPIKTSLRNGAAAAIANTAAACVLGLRLRNRLPE